MKKILLAIFILIGLLVAITFKLAERKKANEGYLCNSDMDCFGIKCTRYNTAVKEGYKPYCINKKCKCMCYGCD